MSILMYNAGFAFLRLIAALIVSMIVADDSYAVHDGICKSCHTAQYEGWSQSHHARSMAVADTASVLGDFSGVTVAHHGTRVTFRRRGERFEALVDEAGAGKVHAVAYVFGHSPLQQYLVPTDGGRYQVLPFAWDTRPKAEGGQRWFPNYPGERLTAKDRLHWQAPLQNWNGMCADCHSTGLERRYDADTDRFDTRYESVNVSCSSCHAGAAQHAADRIAGKDATTWKDGLLDFLRQDGGFERAAGEATAHWTGAQPRKRPEIEICASCHSLREPLGDGIHPGQPYLDQFMPSLLDDPLYFADGQIREEVYVWGSFVQSRMYRQGVSCLDCHDSHSMAVKVQANGLCTQCHASEVFDVPDHHHHPEGGAGSQCVDCHMPARTYMTIDPRRDHSFRVPRPEPSTLTGAPNPCTTCHADRANDWAAEVIARWFPERKKRSDAAVTIHKTRQGDPAARPALARLIGDVSEPDIVRATALSLIPRVASPSLERLAISSLGSTEPLIRIGAIRGLAALPAEVRNRHLIPLLGDKYKAVRIEAARQLIGSTGADLTNPAFAELMALDAASAWRGEGRANLARHYLVRNDSEALEKTYRTAVGRDPGFEPARINLSEFLRESGRADESHALLEKAAAGEGYVDPALHHALGLSYVRLGRLPEALASLKRAMEGDPANPRYAYVYLVGLDGTGEREAAKQMLHDVLEAHPFDDSLLQLGLSWAMRSGDADLARLVLDRLVRLHPDDASLRQMRQRFR